MHRLRHVPVRGIEGERCGALPLLSSPAHDSLVSQFTPFSRLAPASFARVNGQSAVVSQPPGAATDLSALRALLSCPT